MKEQPPQKTFEIKQEKAPDKFPSQEEIKSQLEKFCSGRECKELRVLSDEKGVCLSYRQPYGFLPLSTP